MLVRSGFLERRSFLERLNRDAVLLPKANQDPALGGIDFVFGQRAAESP